MDQTDKLKLEKQELILQAAKACFVKKGFHQTSMQDICHLADMSIGNLYRYFDNKEAIIEAAVELELQWMSNAIAELPATDNLVQAIHDTVIWTASTQMSNGEGEMTAELYAEAGRNPRVNAICARFNKQLSAEICTALKMIEERGIIKPAHSHKDVAVALIALVDGLIIHSIISPGFDLLKLRPTIETMISALLGLEA